MTRDLNEALDRAVRSFLDEDASGLYREWWQNLSRYDRSAKEWRRDLRFALCRFLELAEDPYARREPTLRAQREALDRRPEPTRPGATETQLGPGDDLARGFAKYLSLRTVQRWLKIDPTSYQAAIERHGRPLPLSAAIVKIGSLIEAAAVLQDLDVWTRTEVLDAAYRASRIFYDGVYGEGTRGFLEVAPTTRETGAAAKELHRAIDSRLAVGDRIFVLEEETFDSERHALDDRYPSDARTFKVLPLSFGIRPEHPGGFQRLVLVRPMETRVPKGKKTDGG